MGFRVTLFEVEPDRNMICCICMGVFDNPVKDKCGHSFCYSCLSPWFEKTGSCPISNQLISKPSPDYDMASQINRLQIKCVECKENYIPFYQQEEGCNNCQTRRYSNRIDAANSYGRRNNSRSIPAQNAQRKSSWSKDVIKWGGIAAGVAALAVVASSASKSSSNRK